MKFIDSEKFVKPVPLPKLPDEPLVVHRHDGVGNRRLLIFVHGLNGGRYDTWGNFPKFIFEEEQDLGNVDIGMYAYITGYGRFWSASIELEREARVMADTLRDGTKDYDGIILIGHSMGGLLIKSAIVSLVERKVDDPAALTALQRIAGMFLLATPQLGSLRVPGFLAWLGSDMRALRPHGRLVDNIIGTFQRCIAESEHVKKPNQFVIPVWAVVAAEDFWVDQLSAGITIPDKRRKDVHGSHTRVIKPENRTEDAYQWIVANIAECFKHCTAPSVHALEDLLSQCPPPLTTEVNPYDVLGITRTEHVDDYAIEGKQPPYIPRKKADQELDQALHKTNRFVLLIGRAKSGKSRTAFEAVRRNFPDYVMLIPMRPGDPTRLPELLKSYAGIARDYPKAVLWLDDIERFIAPGALTVSLLNQTRQKHQNFVIVGTLRSIESSKLTSGEGEIGRNAKEVLNNAINIRLDDCLTDKEREIARQFYSKHYPSLNFDNIAVGEAFVAAQELKDRFDNGLDSCPGGSAIVQAAIDCRRIGIIRPISETWLRKLWTYYFHKLDPLKDASELVFDGGLGWAKEPLYHYTALLVEISIPKSSGGFSAPDYLVEHVEISEKPIPPIVWDLAVDRYTDIEADIVGVGYIAWLRGLTDIAKEIWKKGLLLGQGISAFNLGLLLEEAGDRDGARAAFGKGMALGNGKAAYNLGVLLEEAGDHEGAKAALEKSMALGDGLAAFGLGVLLEEAGDHEGAKAAYEQGMALGDGKAAYNLGLLLEEAGDRDGAKQAFQAGVELGDQKSQEWIQKLNR